MKRLALFLISILTVASVFAADVNVKGKVVDAADNEPLIGATVIVAYSPRAAAFASFSI